MVLALLLAAAAQASPTPDAQQATGITRTDLQEHDLSIAGWATVQMRVDFAPGATAPRHVHSGDEIVYVLKGRIEYRLDGLPRATLNAGDVLFIPKGKPHSAANVGLEPASELATYVVQKDQPLSVPLP
jgi:quercetin dioxygenase-like cupin family protein